jgi:hypothetical protein
LKQENISERSKTRQIGLVSPADQETRIQQAGRAVSRASAFRSQGA